ncbi:uncharacterized protein LOC143601700 [Bidens hawaiensis]|uniref:uncharacterized protein LOC143601700 n=1 Tax=Bidens hawaiensis TaxID=980011 RepID=UPI00404B0943
MSHTPRQLIPMASNKPKARDETFGFLKPSTTPKLAKPILPRAMAPAPFRATKPARPVHDNKLLAGYLAHEFLTKGTLFGQKWDPTAAAHSADIRKPMNSQKVKPAEPKLGEKRKFESYAEVSGLVMGSDGMHIPGIFNPTQLTRFLNPQ